MTLRETVEKIVTFARAGRLGGTTAMIVQGLVPDHWTVIAKVRGKWRPQESYPTRVVGSPARAISHYLAIENGHSYHTGNGTVPDEVMSKVHESMVGLTCTLLEDLMIRGLTGEPSVVDAFQDVLAKGG